MTGRVGSSLPSALEALRANKSRSALTTLGIIIGVVAVIVIVGLGVAIVLLVPRVIGMAAVVPVGAIALSVGIAFGVYPARKAAQLDPILALRYQ